MSLYYMIHSIQAVTRQRRLDKYENETQKDFIIEGTIQNPVRTENGYYLIKERCKLLIKR